MFEIFAELFARTWKKFLALFALAIITGAALSFQIQSDLSQKVRTVHEVYIVREGDTLDEIAAYYRDLDCRHPYLLDFLDEVKAANPFLADQKNAVYPGDELHIQYKKAVTK